LHTKVWLNQQNMCVVCVVRVVPVHVGPGDAVGVVLVEEVVEAVEEHRTVGVVHPVPLRHHMELRTQLVVPEPCALETNNIFKKK
jgi:hypothetical protein